MGGNKGKLAAVLLSGTLAVLDSPKLLGILGRDEPGDFPNPSISRIGCTGLLEVINLSPWGPEGQRDLGWSLLNHESPPTGWNFWSFCAGSAGKLGNGNHPSTPGRRDFCQFQGLCFSSTRCSNIVGIIPVFIQHFQSLEAAFILLESQGLGT